MLKNRILTRVRAAPAGQPRAALRDRQQQPGRLQAE